jgi:hypothetical protein
VADLYLLDTNVFIEAATRYYPMDRVPGFWAWLEEEAAEGRLRSISMVQEEVEFPDEVVEWMADREAEAFFLDISQLKVQEVFRDLAGWVLEQNFGPQHIPKFLDGADLWLIAAAVVNNATVVTQERLLDPSSRQIRIPNVCKAHGVECVDTFGLIEVLDASF